MSPQRLAHLALIAFLLVVASCSPSARTAETRHPGAHTSAPLIFGTNLALYDTGDQVVTDMATQRLLQRMAIPIFRVPFRSSFSDAFALRVLQTIKRMGAVPLFIVHGPSDANALADDSHLISLVQRIFGTHTVYIEFGNEADLEGVDVWRYIDAWNAVIPHLQAMAPTYRFVGPANFQPDPTYIATFDRYARPRPYANSWHEYACQPSSPDAYCLSRIDDWTKHILQIDSEVHAAIGASLPLMITEWNLDAQPDARYGNARFIQTWTTHALRTLAANMSNGLMAAMHYCVTNNPSLNLLDATGSPTLEGQAFFHELELAVKGSATSPPSPTTPSAAGARPVTGW